MFFGRGVAEGTKGLGNAELINDIEFYSVFSLPAVTVLHPAGNLFILPT